MNNWCTPREVFWVIDTNYSIHAFTIWKNGGMNLLCLNRTRPKCGTIFMARNVPCSMCVCASTIIYKNKRHCFRFRAQCRFLLLACKFLFISTIRLSAPLAIGSSTRFFSLTRYRSLARSMHTVQRTQTKTTPSIIKIKWWRNNDRKHNLINLWSAENIIWQQN